MIANIAMGLDPSTATTKTTTTTTTTPPPPPPSVVKQLSDSKLSRVRRLSQLAKAKIDVDDCSSTCTAGSTIPAAKKVGEKLCRACQKPTKLTCSKCKNVSLCSKECMIAFWPEHKWTCSTKVEIKSCHGAGMGLFAKCSFNVGEKLISEKMLFCYPDNARNEVEGRQKCASIVAGLNPPVRNITMMLSDWRATNTGIPKTAWGICKANGIPLGHTNQGQDPDGGIFALTCRINHSCKPNAQYLWRSDLKREIVFAMRPITKGEQITVSYILPRMPVAQRQQRLQKLFGFTCACISCVNANEETDGYFRVIQELVDNIPKVGSKVGYADPKKALRMAERALKLLKKIGYDAPCDVNSLHYDAFQMARGINDKRKMAEHLKAALRTGILIEGSDSELVKKFRRLILENKF